MSLEIKRVYDPLNNDDGKRILIDGIWPRGVSRDKVDMWLKEIAPSSELRQWYNHDPEKFEEFKKRYATELCNNKKFFELKSEIEKEKVTLLYATKNYNLSNAFILYSFLTGIDNINKWCKN